MKNSISIKTLQQNLNKLLGTASRQVVFISILVILLAYFFVVWRISSLASAEPSSDKINDKSTGIPKIDKQAVDRILQLEASNSDIKSLFNNARNNPFQE